MRGNKLPTNEALIKGALEETRALSSSWLQPLKVIVPEGAIIPTSAQTTLLETFDLIHMDTDRSCQVSQLILCYCG